MRTAVFDTINSLRPFFFSLRELKNNISLDIKIPSTWKYDIETKDIVTLKVQDQNEKNTLISLVSTATKEGYDAVFTEGKKIIKTNLEMEERNRLFNEKIEELKKFFLEAPIDKLKEISFNSKDGGIRNKQSPREIEMGDTEGSGTDRNSQTEID